MFASALFAWALMSGIALAQNDSAAPTDAEITAAIAELQADPNLTGERQIRTLKWNSENKPRESGALGRWLRGFFEWFGVLSRLLMWAIGAVLAILLAWFLIRTIRGMSVTSVAPSPAPPTHVRDMDIRPESLPDDIGAAALELWSNGQHRAALALLYRGLLSKLAHAHQLPIRDSTTEGDCIALAAQHLPPSQHDFVSRLVSCWQRAIYGGREPHDDEVRALCAEFAPALTPASGTGRSS
jgi:hypothetical protein